MGLIDADKLPFTEPQNSDYKRGWNAALWAVKEMPAVDAVEVRHGKWTQARNNYNGTLKTDEWYGPIFVCSVCGEEMLGTSNFCPSCGSKMDGKAERNE